MALLTAVLADGINLGLTRMADTCRGVTLRQLAWVHDWHIREDAYGQALARLIDTHRAMPLARLWGWDILGSAYQDGDLALAGLLFGQRVVAKCQAARQELKRWPMLNRSCGRTSRRRPMPIRFLARSHRSWCGTLLQLQ